MNKAVVNGMQITSSLDAEELAFIGDMSLDTTASTLSGAINEHESDITTLNSNINSTPTLAQKNSSYVGFNSVYVLRIGHLVNVSGRFEVTTQKPTGQTNYLFSDLPVPKGSVIPVTCSDNTATLIVNGSGQLTSNLSVGTAYYNIDVTYSTD